MHIFANMFSGLQVSIIFIYIFNINIRIKNTYYSSTETTYIIEISYDICYNIHVVYINIKFAV